MKRIIVFTIISLANISYAQDLQQGVQTIAEDINPQGELFSASGPRVDWGPPPKFMSYEYYRYGKVNLTYTDSLGNEYNGTVKSQDEALFKLKFPIYIRPHLSVIGGFQHHYQRYQFDRDDLNGDSPFRNVNNRKFEQVRFDTYVNYTMKRKRFLGFKTGVQLSGDYDNRHTAFSNFVRVQHTGLLGKRYSEKFALAGSYFFAYQPGRLTFYPAVYITYWKNKRIGFESVFPALINLYFHPWEKTFFTGTYSLKSNRYILNNSPVMIGPKETFTLNTTEIQMSMGIQHQVLKFFSLGLEMGYNFNVSSRITDTQARNNQILLQGSQNPGGFLKVTFALTIPKGILDKKQLEEKE